MNEKIKKSLKKAESYISAPKKLKEQFADEKAKGNGGILKENKLSQVEATLISFFKDIKYEDNLNKIGKQFALVLIDAMESSGLADDDLAYTAFMYGFATTLGLHK